MTRIRDIYTGKPDAKDEIETEGEKSFLETYIEPISFDLNSIVSGTNCFVSGFKGTGKTALLYYLDDYIKRSDSVAYSSFVFFKDGIPNITKQEMEVASKRMTSFISIGKDVVIDGNEFEVLWRWLIYQRIWEDNIDCNNGLFENDDQWKKFDKIIQKTPPPVKRKLSIPSRLKLAIPVKTGDVTISPEAEIDFTSANVMMTAAYRQLLDMIATLDEIFPTLKRTDIPYYIFVDELEAYYGDEKIFKRDLYLIRDLIFTVKNLNTQFMRFGNGKTKIVCSVRKEILNAINRFIVSKELNKVTSGFDVPMVWNYTNTNSFNHPILRMLVKRIQLAETLNGVQLTEEEIVQKWFPEKIDGFEPANYILNYGWNKPRDIVRLIKCAQASLCNDYTLFNKAVFDGIRKEYSRESLDEIREEMLALYSEKETADIIMCLMGFRAIFTLDELNNRIERYYQGTIWKTETLRILQDLYRLGFIGNISKSRRSYRWQHKGDDQLILSDDWDIMVHRALQSVLSINTSIAGKNLIQQPSNIYEVTICALSLNYIDVSFVNEGKKSIARIRSEDLLKSISAYKLGEKLSTIILDKNTRKNKWLMKEIEQ